MTAHSGRTHHGPPLDILDSALVARATQRLALAAAALLLAWVAMAGVSGTALWIAVLFAACAVGVAAGMHGATRRRLVLVLRAGLVVAAASLTGGALAVGPDEAPFILFYVWLAPFAFLVWRPGPAASYVALISLAATTLLGWHPGHAPFDRADLPAWLIALGGPLSIGWVVARLTERVVERHAHAARVAESQTLVTGLARRAISETHVAGTVAKAAAQVLMRALGAWWVDVRVTGGDETVAATAGSAPPHGHGVLTELPIGDDRSRLVIATRAELDDEQRSLAAGVAEVLDVAGRRARREHEARAKAGVDPVTSLPGRELFTRQLDRRLRDGTGGTLLLLDLNDFGLVNDTLGPVAGDRLLRDVGRRLRDAATDEVAVGRIGGDEFALFAPGVENDSPATELGRRLQRALRDPFEVSGTGHDVSASIGVLVLAPGAYADAQSALRDVHVAQRRATKLGRGRLEVFDAGMRSELEQRRALEHDLRQALRDREFRLVYQPIVELPSRQVVGAEALLRWERPGIGTVGPASFMEVAEGSDLIVPIGAWVLREALRQLKAWEETIATLGAFRLSINLSGRQLADPGFAATVRKLVAGYGIAPHRVCFELTETALVDEGCDVEATIAELRRLGVSLALDDFGTGYASLRYLRRFPFETLKLDRSLVVGRSLEELALTRAAISMGQALGMHVLAEGLETEERIAELAEMGCGLGQGYGFGRPTTASGLRRVLRQRGARPAA